jgi:hypothetical protein
MTTMTRVQRASRAWIPLAGLASVFLARSASADPRVPEDVPDAPQSTASPSRAIDRTWLYADDARVPAPWTVVGMTSVSYTSVGSSPSRIASPFPSSWYSGFGGNTAQPGGMVSVGAEAGILPHVAIVALGQIGFGGAEGTASPDAGVVAGLRFQLLPSSWEHVHLVASGGYLREASVGPVHDEDTDTWTAPVAGGAHGAFGQVAFAAETGRLRMAATVHGEHVFSPGRDGVDVMVQLGASMRVVDRFRLGVEYVGQDLEESFRGEAEGGARHFLGPTASMQFLLDRLSVVAGPSFGLSDLSPQLLGRLAVAYAF